MENDTELKIQDIQNKEVWDDFLLKCEEKTFLQSWNWGEFQKMMGNKIWRLGIFIDGGLTSISLVVKIEAKRGSFLFLPHGPIVKSNIKYQKSKILELFLEELKKIAREEKASFIRISSIWQRNEGNIRIFKDLGFRESPIHMHAEVTWELDIKPSEEELLAGMRKTTRYLIRQAEKNPDVKIYHNPNLEDIDIFNRIYQETVKRQHFTPFSLIYLKNEFSAFAPEGEISIFFGKYRNEIISAGIFIFWQGIAFYHHGANSFKYPKIPAAYLMMWEAIKEAKKRGCRLFNFWGIASDDNPNHPWAGLTLFKIGFSGRKKEYVRTQDFVISKKYWLTYLFEKLRRIKRGL